MDCSGFDFYRYHASSCLSARDCLGKVGVAGRLQMAKTRFTNQASIGSSGWRALGALALAFLSACEESPQERCVKSRLKVWDAHSEKTPWRISEATGQTRSDFEAKAHGWCAQETASQ